MKLNSKFFVHFWLAVLLIPGSVTLVSGFRAQRGYIKENRNLAPLPKIEFSKESILGFPNAFQAYIDDTFFFRNRIIEYRNRFLLRFFNESGVNKVTLGLDGWLFYTDELSSSLGYRNFYPQTMDKEIKFYREHCQHFNDQSAKAVWLNPPNKASVYPEKFSRHWNLAETRNHYKQLIETFTHVDNCRLVQPLADLQMAKTSRRQVYYQTDTHWNLFGASVAYQKLLTELNNWYPDILNFQVHDSFIESGTESGDLAHMLGVAQIETWQHYKADFLTEFKSTPFNEATYNGKHTFYQSGKNIKVLVFHDSFMDNFGPLLSHTFREVIFIDEYSTDQQYLVKTFKPDLVILEYVERSL